MKKRFYFILALVFILLISCGGEIKISLYTRDLSDILSSKEEVLYTNVNMTVERLTEAKDIEYLRKNLYGFSNEHSTQHNYSTALSFDIKIPIVKEGSSYYEPNCLFTIEERTNANKTDYYLIINEILFSRINSYFYSIYYKKIDPKDFTIQLEINNDERNPVSLITYSSYINGKSYPFEHVEFLKERDRIIIEISKVFCDYIFEMDNNSYPIFSIKKK